MKRETECFCIHTCCHWYSFVNVSVMYTNKDDLNSIITTHPLCLSKFKLCDPLKSKLIHLSRYIRCRVRGTLRPHHECWIHCLSYCGFVAQSTPLCDQFLTYFFFVSRPMIVDLADSSWPDVLVQKHVRSSSRSCSWYCLWGFKITLTYHQNPAREAQS